MSGDTVQLLALFVGLVVGWAIGIVLAVLPVLIENRRWRRYWEGK